MAASDLTIQPSELKFRFELRKNIPVTLSLHNPGQERVAFKVKTTSPKKYCVRPSSGIVEPGTTKDVQVIMQAQREYPPTGLQDCKDKFLVQTIKVADSVTDITPDLFDAPGSSGLKQTKLRVVLVGPPKPPSPVPEGVEEEASTPDKTTFSDATGTTPATSQNGQELAQITQERNKLRDTLQRVEQDKANIKKRLEQLQLQVGIYLSHQHCVLLLLLCKTWHVSENVGIDESDQPLVMLIQPSLSNVCGL